MDYQLLLSVTIISGKRKMFTTTLHSISNPTDLLDYICLTTLYCSRNLISLLFFSALKFIHRIVGCTNDCAFMRILSKPSYAKPDGSWEEATDKEMKNLIAFLLYMGLVRVANYEQYWSVVSLFNGLWGRVFFSPGRRSKLYWPS